MKEQLSTLTNLIRWINQQGWSPATSTNYSHRDATNPELAYISRSGVDKSCFETNDFILMDLNGQHQEGYQSVKASAETEIHLMLYKHTDANVVLHSHSIPDTVLSRFFAPESFFRLENFEVLKGLRNIDTHETYVDVPIFPNDQDITRLSEVMRTHISTEPRCQGMLIESHGFYTWGRDLAEAKKHLEVFQYLFNCELEWLKLPHPQC